MIENVAFNGPGYASVHCKMFKFFPESNEQARPAAAGPLRVRGGRTMAGTRSVAS
jgi:hypothetical protein